MAAGGEVGLRDGDYLAGCFVLYRGAHHVVEGAYAAETRGEAG